MGCGSILSLVSVRDTLNMPWKHTFGQIKSIDVFNWFLL